MIAVAHWKMDGCWMDLILHAEKGEQWADEAISEIADNFAKTVRNLITLFCPELIIIGGHAPFGAEYLHGRHAGRISGLYEWRLDHEKEMGTGPGGKPFLSGVSIRIPCIFVIL